MFSCSFGGIAQLARVLDWQSRGRGFESPYLHHRSSILPDNINTSPKNAPLCPSFRDFDADDYIIMCSPCQGQLAI